MFQFLCCSDAILTVFVSISEFDDSPACVPCCIFLCISKDSLFQDSAESSKADRRTSPVQASRNCKPDLVQLSSLLHLSCGWPRVTLFHPLTTSHPVTPLHALLRSPHTTFSDHRGRVRPPLTTTRVGGIIPTPLFCIR